MKIVSGFFCLSRHFLFFCFRSLVPSTRGWARQHNGKLCFVLVGKFLVMNFCVGISRKSCDRQTIALADLFIYHHPSVCIFHSSNGFLFVQGFGRQRALDKENSFDYIYLGHMFKIWVSCMGELPIQKFMIWTI